MITNFTSKNISCVTRLLFLGLLVICIVGCVRDELAFSADKSEKVSINLSLPGMTMTRAGGPITDESVERVRIFAFDRNENERCVLNKLMDLPTDPFVFELLSGRYDFHFVINEPDDRANTAVGTPSNSILSGIVNREQLEAYRVINAQLVSADGLFVMSASQKDVLVEANYNRPSGNNSYHSMVSYTDWKGDSFSRVQEMSIMANRLAVKVNLKLAQKDGSTTALPYTDFNDVRIKGLPASAPVLQNVYSTIPATSEVVFTTATINSYPDNGTTYAGYTAIIPCYTLAKHTDKKNAATLCVTLASETTPRTMAIGHDIVEPIVDYSLRRNTIYHILGKVAAGGLPLNIQVLDWDEHPLNQTVGWSWRGPDEIYLSSRSPIGLRRAGLLVADDFSLRNMQIVVIDHVSPSAPRMKGEFVTESTPMKDRDNVTYKPYVTHLVGLNNNDVVLTQTGGLLSDVNTSVDANHTVKMRIYSGLLTGAYKEVTVHLNRTKIDDFVWVDKNIGATDPRHGGTYIQGGSLTTACPTGYKRPNLTEWKANLGTNTALSTHSAVVNMTFSETSVTYMPSGSVVYFDKAGHTSADDAESWFVGVRGSYIGENALDNELWIYGDRVDGQDKSVGGGGTLDLYKMRVRCMKTI